MVQLCYVYMSENPLYGFVNNSDLGEISSGTFSLDKNVDLNANEHLSHQPELLEPNDLLMR